MLAERPPDLGKRQALGMVAGEPQSISRFKALYSGGQRAAYQFEETCPFGWAAFRPVRERCNRLLFSVDRFETPCSAETIDVPLSKHGAEPGRQRAAAVEVAEERSPLAVPLGHSKKVSIQSVGRFAGGTGLVDGVRRSIKDRPMLADELFPGGFISIGARDGEGDVAEVESRGVTFSGPCRRAVRKGVRDAGLQRRGESIVRHAPSAGVRFLVEPLDDRRIEHRLVLCPRGGS